MNRKLVCQRLGLTLLGLTTYLGAAKLLAQGHPKSRPIHSANVVSSPSQPSRVATAVRARLDEDALPAANPSNGMASIPQLKVDLLGDRVHVWGQASIREFRQNVSYVWSIRVRNPVMRVFVAEQRYDTQVFQVPQDTHELDPTFEDTIPLALPNGIYNVELVFYEVPSGGVGRLDDSGVKGHQLMAKNAIQISIGG